MRLHFHILCSAALIAACLASTPAQARPVSYADGSMVMGSSDADHSHLSYLYSPTSRVAFGPRMEIDHDNGDVFGGVEFNALLKRWNNFDSQGNIYWMSAAGINGLDGGGDDTRLSGLGGFQADWEDRRYYTSYANEYRFDADENDYFKQTARVGIAPYIAESGALHTWLMVQVDHMPENADDDHWRVTPLVRLFHGDVLGEAGVSLDGDLLLNLDVTF